jgi:hypothetical protein
MWQILGRMIDTKRFERFEPLDVLNYYDGPKLFTLVDSTPTLCLACWSDQDEVCSRFLVVETTEQMMFDLECGLITIDQALHQENLFVVDVAHEGVVKNVWEIEQNFIPDDARPGAGIYLNSRSPKLKELPMKTHQLLQQV